MKKTLVGICMFVSLISGCAGNQAFKAMPQHQQTAWSRCYPTMQTTLGATTTSLIANTTVMKQAMDRYVAASEEQKPVLLLQNGCQESIVRAFYPQH